MFMRQDNKYGNQSVKEILTSTTVSVFQRTKSKSLTWCLKATTSVFNIVLSPSVTLNVFILAQLWNKFILTTVR